MTMELNLQLVHAKDWDLFTSTNKKSSGGANNIFIDRSYAHMFRKYIYILS